MPAGLEKIGISPPVKASHSAVSTLTIRARRTSSARSRDRPLSRNGPRISIQDPATQPDLAFAENPSRGRPSGRRHARGDCTMHKSRRSFQWSSAQLHGGSRIVQLFVSLTLATAGCGTEADSLAVDSVRSQVELQSSGDWRAVTLKDGQVEYELHSRHYTPSISGVDDLGCRWPCDGSDVLNWERWREFLALGAYEYTLTITNSAMHTIQPRVTYAVACVYPIDRGSFTPDKIDRTVETMRSLEIDAGRSQVMILSCPDDDLGGTPWGTLEGVPGWSASLLEVDAALPDEPLDPWS
jgi:hypothetical protein